MKKYYKENNYIHYSNCHEDSGVLLSQIKISDKIALSIASAGDNTFSLLTHNFDTVYAFDYNPSQLALMKLKAYGIKYLPRDEFLVFIGVIEGNSLGCYQKIYTYLDNATRKYFDEHLFLINEVKIIHCGRFEYYFQLFHKYILRFTHSKKAINKFMNFTSVEEQWIYYQTKFNNRRFRLLFNLFFSKKIMKKYGRDASFFNYASGNLVSHLKGRLELGFKNVLNKENPYIQYAIFNKFITLPHYLHKENYELIKKNIDKIVYIEGDTYTIYNLNIRFDFLNLSDIFEYMSEEETSKNEQLISSICNKDARIIFWNMMVPRAFKSNKFKQINTELIFYRDKVFYYSALKIYEANSHDN